MSEGRGRAAWSHTAQILAMLANVNRPKGKRAFKAEEFNPYGKENSKPVQRSKDLSILKAVFVDSKKKGQKS